MPFSDTVRRVIDLATAIDDYWDRELPKRHPTYPIVQEGADDGPPPAEEKELRDLLHSLPPADVYKLVALMGLGREDFSASEFGHQWQELAKGSADPGWAIWQMMEKATLADYLSDGLQELAACGIDVDAVGSAAA